MAKAVGALTPGLPNTVYMSNSIAPEKNRWTLASNKSEYLFKLFDDGIFES
jgi:hypothetical protein